MNEVVCIQTEKDPKDHWFRKLLYIKDGPKFTLITKRLGYFVIAAFCVISVSLVLQGPPKNNRSSKVSSFSTPNPVAEVGSIVLPSASMLQATTTLPERRIGRVKMFLGPELVLRPKIPIPSGTTVKAKLITGATNGPLQAQVTESFPSRQVAETENPLII